MPVTQIPDLPPLQDVLIPASQLATASATSDVTIPMLHDNIPGTVPGVSVPHTGIAANQAPGLSRGLPEAQASPMQLGTLAALPQRMPRLTMTIEEALLQGVTLLCSPQQEASLLNPQPTLMDNHIKMMDALQHLDTVGLQFICKSVEAPCREITPTQAPPGYCMQQASNILCGVTSQSHSLMSHEFYRAVSNLGTAIVEPQLIPLQ